MTDETVLERLVPNDPEAVKSFLEMRVSVSAFWGVA